MLGKCDTELARAEMGTLLDESTRKFVLRAPFLVHTGRFSPSSYLETENEITKSISKWFWANTDNSNMYHH